MKLYTVIIALLLSLKIFSQGIAINTTGNVADTSAILDININDKGILIPRLTTTERNAIISPANSLIIFNTTTKCFEFYESGSWYNMACACTPPDVPVAIAALDVQATEFDANWNAASGAATYYLDVASDPAFTSILSGYNNLNTGNVLTYNVSGLTCNTTYYYRVRAGNSCNNTGNSNTISQLTSACFSCGGTLQDIDGNNYNTVQIGSQCWMKENLRTTTYRNGVPIPNETNNATWAALSTGAWCYYNNNSSYNTPYGKFYNWFAVNDTSTLCPSGWHMPTDAEWCTMENTVEAGTDAGCNIIAWRGTATGTKLKTNVDWVPAGTDNFGFTAYPGGYRNSGDGSFNDFFDLGRWWTATESGPSNAYFRTLRRDYTSIQRGAPDKTYGFFVRCVKD